MTDIKQMFFAALIVAVVGGGAAMEMKERHLLKWEAMGEKVIDKLPDLSESREDTPRERLWRRILIRDSVPYLDIPMEFRVPNYKGGSCVFAAFALGLNNVGMHEMASWITSHYGHGEYSSRLNRRLDAAGIRYAYTMDGDVEFLEKCCALRLGCAVNWPSAHMVYLVGIDDEWVYLIDNNSIRQVKKRSRQQFLREWTGWAVTPVYVPSAPEPFALARKL